MSKLPRISGDGRRLSYTLRRKGAILSLPQAGNKIGKQDCESSKFCHRGFFPWESEKGSIAPPP